MPTCCKSITVTIGSGGCVAGANGTDPTPNTLLVVGQHNLMSQITVNSIDGVFSSSIPWPFTIPVGLYSLEYVSGFWSWFVSSDPTCLLPPHTSYGDDTGSHLVMPFGVINFGMNFHKIGGVTDVFATISGEGCGNCGVADICDTNALQVLTLAGNPVIPLFQVDSATFGSTGGNVATGSSIGGTTGAFGVLVGVKPISWRLFQLQYVQEQPLCVQIKDYAAVKAAIGVCVNTADQSDYCAFFPANCSVAINEWTGTFPFRRVFYPNAADRQVQFFTINVDLITFTQLQFTLNGQALATSSAGRTSIAYREVAGVGFWELIIMGYVSPVNGSLLMIWYGTKSTGTDPIGEYTYDASQLPCATGPATICIEACP